MMRKLLICLSLTLSMFQATQAQSQEDRGRQYQSVHFNYGDFTVGYSIFQRDLAATPSWQPEREEEPPISLNQALEIARKNLGRLIKESARLIVGKVELRRFEEDKWVYEISFKCGNGENCGTGFFIFVKMDGSVFEPEFVPVETLKK